MTDVREAGPCKIAMPSRSSILSRRLAWLLLVPLAGCSRSGETRPPEVDPDPQVAPAAGVTLPKVAFVDVTEKAGIRFRHTSGAFGKKLLPETMGSGCAFLDFDNDGHQDLLFVNA